MRIISDVWDAVSPKAFKETPVESTMVAVPLLAVIAILVIMVLGFAGVIDMSSSSNDSTTCTPVVVGKTIVAVCD